MLPASSRYASDDKIEIVVSEREEHILQLIGGIEGETLWVNGTQKGMLAGGFDILKQHYKEIEALHLLDVLVKKGLIKRIDNGIVLLCPSCGSHEAAILLSCPSCSSHELRRNQKIAHKSCGHWGIRDDFIRDGKVKCPKCEARATLDDLHGGEEFSFSDPYYECSKCGFITNRGLYLHLCKSCGKRFNISKAVQIEQTGYKLTADPVGEPIENQKPIEPTREPPRLKEEIKQKLTQEPEPEADKDPVVETKILQETAVKTVGQEEINQEPELVDIPIKKREETPDQVGEPVKLSQVKMPVHKNESIQGIEMVPKPANEAVVDTVKEELLEETYKSMEEFLLDYRRRIDDISQIIDPLAEEPSEEDTEPESVAEPLENVIIEEKVLTEPEKEFDVYEIILEPNKELKVKPEIEEEIIPMEPEPEGTPEDVALKVLMIVEDQMFFNLIVESLEKVGKSIEVNYVEDENQALKSLRVHYDLIIMDSELSKADPNFIIREMEKRKVNSPLILLDNGRLGKIPKKLNTIAVLQRKQRDIRSIAKRVAEIF